MNSFRQNPLASIFIKASKVYMTVKTYLGGEWGRAFTVRGRQHRGKGRRGLQREPQRSPEGGKGRGSKETRHRPRSSERLPSARGEEAPRAPDTPHGICSRKAEGKSR